MRLGLNEMNFFLIQCPHRIQQPIPKQKFHDFSFNQIVLTKKRIAVNHLTFKMNQVKSGQQDMDYGGSFLFIDTKNNNLSEKNYIFKQKIRMQSIFKLGQVRYNYKKNTWSKNSRPSVENVHLEQRKTFRLKIFSIIRSVILKIQFDAISRVSACSYLLWTP